MVGVAAIIELRFLVGGIPFPSMQNTAGSLVAETLLFFCFFGQSLRYLEEKKKRSYGIVTIVAVAIIFGLIVTTYLSLH
jgi:hypothetical protein